MKSYSLYSALALTLFLNCFSAFAESSDETDSTRKNRTHHEHKEFFKKMKEKRAAMLREEIGLSEERAEKIESIFAKHDEQRRIWKKQMHQSKKELKKLLKEDSDDQNAYKAVLAKLKEAHEQMDKIRTQQIEAVAKELTPKEQAKMLQSFYQMKKKFKKGMKKMHHQHSEKE